MCNLVCRSWSAAGAHAATFTAALTAHRVSYHMQLGLQVKKLCLTERHERTHAAAKAAKSGQPQLPPALEARGGRTPEMRMASAIMVRTPLNEGC